MGLFTGVSYGALPDDSSYTIAPSPTLAPAATSTPVRPTATPRPPAPTPTRTVVPPTRTPALKATVPAASSLPGELTAEESALLAMVNDERLRAGVPPLTLDPVLQSVAHARAVDMLTRKFYSHIDPLTGQHAARAMLLDLGVTYKTSENFYSGLPYNAAFVARAMQWFMVDAVHRNNLLLRYWNRVGVGVAGTPGRIAVVTQVFGAK